MTTITLTADENGNPAPYVDVLVEGFPAGVSSTTIWRTARGRAFRVRGLVGVSTSGIVTIRDFEAPLGVEATYRAEQFDSDGEFVSWSSPATVTLPAGDLETAWFHSPLDPTTSVQVVMTLDAAKVLVRPTTAERFKVVGRSVQVIITGARKGLQGVVLNCSTETLAAADKLDALFGAYAEDNDDTVPILCVRTHPHLRLPPTLFAWVEEPAQMPLAVTRNGEIIDWELVADEVAPPPEAAITALLDYDDFTAFYSDYAAFTAAYVDYREAQRDYSIAGTA